MSTSCQPTDLLVPPPAREQAANAHVISETDAVDIWIARWLRIRRIDLVRRYQCDPRRLYEIWEGKRFPAARERAMTIFKAQHPTLLDRIDFGPHQRIPRSEPGADQLTLFDEA